MYKTILERNADLLKAIAEAKERKKKREVKAVGAKAHQKDAAVTAAPVPAGADNTTAEAEGKAGATAEDADGTEKATEKVNEAPAAVEPIVVE